MGAADCTERSRGYGPVLETDKFYVTNRALINWGLLPEASRTEILSALEELAGKPPEAWHNARVERWSTEDNLYALHVRIDQDDALVFFRPENGRIHLDSMLAEKMIDRSGKRP